MEPDTLAALNPDGVALFLDVDGTLLDLAPAPDAVDVPLTLRDVLRSVDSRVSGALALVSGRPIAQLDALLAPPRLRASGVHGAEIRYSPDELSQSPQPRLPDAAWRALTALMAEFPGTLAENKGFSFTVHYRNAPRDAERLLNALERLVSLLADPEVELLAGHLVFEIKRGGFDKGDAIVRFMARRPFLGRRPVFVADDEIDRSGFNSVLAMGGLAFSVGGKLSGVSDWFSGPGAVRTWLGAFGGE